MKNTKATVVSVLQEIRRAVTWVVGAGGHGSTERVGFRE